MLKIKKLVKLRNIEEEKKQVNKIIKKKKEIKQKSNKQIKRVIFFKFIFIFIAKNITNQNKQILCFTLDKVLTLRDQYNFLKQNLRLIHLNHQFHSHFLNIEKKNIYLINQLFRRKNKEKVEIIISNELINKQQKQMLKIKNELNQEYRRRKNTSTIKDKENKLNKQKANKQIKIIILFQIHFYNQNITIQKKQTFYQLNVLVGKNKQKYQIIKNQQLIKIIKVKIKLKQPKIK
ncbi:hypothetical protein TTHERM_001053102 (macronuclear) [Tetrahymena thermophila SB210]|uniref:Uncharacterized protein n=1 Tax=Tetrahymena thermophila (strain SB210) TaxID=312017 RepID=W7XKY1_TETTS|nr:hypothetical protein TTHERM_001053102 [Tetrahymena thermophila SB210]EWS75329.1 hypothetical protein TTHERM_001053102 [Tetrahymena thermophila SB210]|eukprot:XP_012652141.1 hypothetical protein TTHERM_001053102 [Tetrahymena thermophila SB210]